MNLESYDIVYILGNLFMAYVIYHYMYVFYSSCKVSRWIERLCYIGYFAGITLTHTFLEIPIIVLVTNLVFITLLTLLYDGNIKKSLLSTAIMCFSLTLIETIIAFITSTLQLNMLVPFEYESEIGIVLIRLFSFSFVMWVKGFMNVNKDPILPVSYWISLVVIPVGTEFMLFTVYMDEDLPRTITLICLCCAFMVNIVSFYLYDKISGLLSEQMERRVAEEQNRFYEYQVCMMKDTLDSIRMFRHDMKNKLSALYMLAQKDQHEELMLRLEELTDVCNKNKEYAHSGNITIDSIINYKLQKAEEKHIRITADIIVPKELTVSTFDITVVFGNLLDNAIEAVTYVEDRWIDIRTKYTKGRLIIEISNSYDGTLLRTAKGIVSRKEDKENHGMGIKSVEMTLEKYDGALQITQDDAKFTAKVLMYL